ncbi:universal stress protein [Natronococcus roseus]|uniref:universal stress protein n=1 Tax=Natronococcus roseus TaxID=1052014 RepID=UPI00374CE0BB
MAVPDHRVLVPVDVLGGESVPQTVIDVLASVPVVLLGYRELPEQTGTDQARDRYGSRVRAELDELHAVFEDAGCLEVSSRSVFTHDRLKTFERVAVETDCDAILLVNPAPVLERVLVAVRGDVNLEYIARFLGAVLANTDLEVTFLHVADEDERTRRTELLEVAVDELAATGVARERIDTSLVVDGSPTRAILETAADHNLLVVGESRPSVRRYVFKDRAKRLARETVDPVLVIRGEYLEGTEGAGDGDAADDESASTDDADGSDESL